MTEFVIKVRQMQQKAAFRRGDEHQVQLVIDVEIACRKRCHRRRDQWVSDLLTDPIKKPVRMMIVNMRAIEDRDGRCLNMIEISDRALELAQTRVMQRRASGSRDLLQTTQTPDDIVQFGFTGPDKRTIIARQCTGNLSLEQPCALDQLR